MTFSVDDFLMKSQKETTMKTMKNLPLCIMTVVVVLLQLMSPAPVRAEGETPPPATGGSADTTPTPDPAETSTPIPSPVGTLEPALDTTVATLGSDVPAASAEGNPAASVTPEAPSPTSVLEAAQTIADNTNVVVLDENGQSLPLASQEAAQVITNSDPVWCPAGQAPTPGTNGCTTAYATLSDLVTNEGGNIAADGTIWITSGPVPEVSTVTVDGSTYTTWSNYALTLQGGWSGTSGDPNVGSNAVFSVPIEIINWNNNIFINNVSIENVVTTGIDWIDVQTNSGDITISNTNISNNTNNTNISGFTAFTAGIRLYAPEHVTINNSNFSNNVGASSVASANLTINNSNFTNTQIAEAAINYLPLRDCSGDTVSNVFISNSNFNNTLNGAGFAVIGVCKPDDHLYITIDNSSFNDNIMGAYFGSGNITISNSNFNNNSTAGVGLVGKSTINNSIFSGNGAGIIPADDVTLNDVIIANNDVGVEATCLPDIQLTLNRVSFLGNGVDIGSKILGCTGTPFKIITSDSTFTISSQTEGEFALDCASVDGYSVNLLNGNLVQIFCPVSGRARISSLEPTALPAPLPADYSYASAFSLDILQNEMPIPVITEGGYLRTSFAASSPQAGDTYSILYWDNGSWISLKELTLDENGSLQLNPDASEDPREILSGVKLVTDNGSPRVEVSTNFPGIFVLAQH
jgi:hypothetical protein